MNSAFVLPRDAEGRRSQLRAIPLFAACTDDELSMVATLTEDFDVAHGETVIEEGRMGRQSYIIVTGEVQVAIGGKTVATLGPGEFFGEMALLGREPIRTATVTAVAPTYLLAVDAGRLAALLEIGSVAVAMLKDVIERLRAAELASG